MPPTVSELSSLDSLRAWFAAHEKYCTERHDDMKAWQAENTKDHAQIRTEMSNLRVEVTTAMKDLNTEVSARIWNLMIASLGGTLIMVGIVLWSLIRKGAGLP